jgi:cytochrome c peroxidase
MRAAPKQSRDCEGAVKGLRRRQTSATLACFIPAAALAQSYLPQPRIPADNPMSEVKVRLGRYLFYDKRMSANGTQSCASCHRQELAFTDGRAVSVGATGQRHTRSAMTLVNAALNPVLDVE